MPAIAMTITANVLTTAPTAASSLMPMALHLARTSLTPPCWIKAPGLDNVKLTNDNTISTDYRGYAIVPYVTPYRRTDITP